MVEHIEYGVSFGSAIREVKNVKEIDRGQYALIELPFGNQCCDEKLYEKLRKNNFKIGFHIPSEFIFQKFQFMRNIHTKEQVNQVAIYVDEYLSKSIHPEYVLIHVPLTSKDLDKNGVYEINRYYVECMKKIMRTRGIKLYIENVAANRYFYEWNQYKELFDANTKMCFDIGHAHTMQAWIKESRNKDMVSDYFQYLNDYIECIHLYNTTKSSIQYKNHMHYPFLSGYEESEGFMDYDDICRKICSLNKLKYIIFEPHREYYQAMGSFGDKIILER